VYVHAKQKNSKTVANVFVIFFTADPVRGLLANIVSRCEKSPFWHSSRALQTDGNAISVVET